MDRSGLEQYIAGTYSVEAEYPWLKSPRYAVFRRRDNRKWFALVMELPKERLGLAEPGAMDILNVKCDPIMLGSLRAEPGVFPAYHMNKANWVSVALDGRVRDELVAMLLDMSFQLTAPKSKRPGASPQSAVHGAGPSKSDSG